MNRFHLYKTQSKVKEINDYITQRAVNNLSILTNYIHIYNEYMINSIGAVSNLVLNMKSMLVLPTFWLFHSVFTTKSSKIKVSILHILLLSALPDGRSFVNFSHHFLLSLASFFSTQYLIFLLILFLPRPTAPPKFSLYDVV